MTTARGNAILTDTMRFEVLDLVSIALPSPWLWHHDDIDEPHAVGAFFHCYENDGVEHDLGYLGVVDVTLDPEEPDIIDCNESNVVAVDRKLEQGVRRAMEGDGRQFKRWMKSYLNHLATGKALVTAYIGEDRGRDRQYVDARIRVQQRKVVVAACFDMNRANELAVPIFSAVSNVVPLKGAR